MTTRTALYIELTPEQHATIKRAARAVGSKTTAPFVRETMVLFSEFLLSCGDSAHRKHFAYLNTWLQNTDADAATLLETE